MNISSTNARPVHRWTLELRGPDELRPKFVDRSGVMLQQVELPLPAFNRFLHEAVGADFDWGGREAWSIEDWSAYAGRDELQTWVLYVQGTPAGYFETEHFDDRSARIQTFGLVRPFFGRGLGAHLLTCAVQRAFDRGASRIWVRTCSKDHPHALANYQARGFRIVKEETLKA